MWVAQWRKRPLVIFSKRVARLQRIDDKQLRPVSTATPTAIVSTVQFSTHCDQI